MQNVSSSRRPDKKGQTTLLKYFQKMARRYLIVSVAAISYISYCVEYRNFGIERRARKYAETLLFRIISTPGN